MVKQRDWTAFVTKDGIYATFQFVINQHLNDNMIDKVNSQGATK